MYSRYSRRRISANSGDAPPFKAGEAVEVGDLRTYNGIVYRCVQAHTSADHWAPDVAHSLWVVA